MVSKSNEASIIALKEATRLLRLALSETEALLIRTRRMLDCPDQDNDPPKRH
jgi:hypothetical protein